MARKVEYRIVFQGILRTVTPLHIGSGSEGLLSDAMLARDGQGNLVVSGTSLTGPIRGYLERYFNLANSGESASDDKNSLLGFQQADLGAASRLIVEDATLDGMPATEVRDSVGIGRASGVAVDQLKYDREILPAGVNIPLRLQWDCRDELQKVQFNAAIGSLVGALASDRIRFGACVMRGLGRVRLMDDYKTHCFALRTPRGTIDWLEHLVGAVPGRDAAFSLPKSIICDPPSLDIEIAFEPVGPLMVKAAIDGDGADILPLVTRVGGSADTSARVLPVIPGTSIRGALRSDAERVLRTLLGTDSADHPADKPADHPAMFQESLEELPLICWIFGRAGQRVEGTADHETDSGGGARGDTLLRQGRGALAIDDCMADPTRFPNLNASQWAEIAKASVDIPTGRRNSPLREVLDRFGLPAWTTGFRVAIDRWTGGAAEGMFFKILEPRSVPWEPIRLRLDLERLPEVALAPALALLLLVLDRFAQGLTPLGHGVNRGLGDVRVNRIGIRGQSLPDWLEALKQLEFESSEGTSLLAQLDVDLRTALAEHWHAHLRDASSQEEQGN